MTEKCQSAFERLKKALVSAPVLGYPTREGKFVLDPDAASATVIQWRSHAAVLSQTENGKEKVIAYCRLYSTWKVTKGLQYLKRFFRDKK